MGNVNSVIAAALRFIPYTKRTSKKQMQAETMKEALLSALGLTVAECHDYRQFRQQQDESVTDLAVRLKRLSKRYAKGCATVEDLSEQMAKE